jgi:alpha-L-fucosidase
MTAQTPGPAPTGPAPSGTFNSGLVKKGRLPFPLLDCTPLVWKNQLIAVENWHLDWEKSNLSREQAFLHDQVRIRDISTNQIIGIPLIGYTNATGLVWEDKLYIIAGYYADDTQMNETRQIHMVYTEDLVNWSKPAVILEAEEGRFIHEMGICRGDGWFVLATRVSQAKDDAGAVWFFASDDLLDWSEVPGARYGVERPVDSPSLYYFEGRYYLLYAEQAGPLHITRVTRSADLIHWQDADADRPVITPDTTVTNIPHHAPTARETNASNARLAEYRGRTVMFYTAGDRTSRGDLKYAEAPESPYVFLSRFYYEPRIMVPNARQTAFQEQSITVLFNFGMGTYSGGDTFGIGDKSLFYPVALNLDQWFNTARNLGVRSAVFSAKHPSGFCLWPTVTSSYCIKNSPWKGGHGDLVREFVDAANRAKFTTGIYASPADINKGVFSTDVPVGQRVLNGDRELYFRNIFLVQLKELLTNYGPLTTIWLETRRDPLGWDVRNKAGSTFGTIHGDAMFALIEKLQPNAGVIGGTLPDGQILGTNINAPDPVVYPVYPGFGPSIGAPYQYTGWNVPYTILAPRGNAVWKVGTDDHLMSTDKLFEVYYNTVGMGTNLFFTITPDPTGVVPDAEVNMVRMFGDELRRRFAVPVAKTTSTDNWREGNALELEISQEKGKPFDHIILEEDLTKGQRVSQHRIDMLTQGGDWMPIAHGSTIGRKRIHRVPLTSAKTVRLVVNQSIGTPQIRLFGVYNCTKR